ncbi:MAG: TetR family transcriptional regulator [Pleurocapsa sp.]
MSSSRKSTKARLIEAAFDLFAEKGVTETTTRAVAERAKVNEVTLFRKFGSKHRLMLAVIEDSAIFDKLVHTLVEQANTKESVEEFIQAYARESLKTLRKAPDLIRSVVGEAGNYPLENRLALGRGLTEANGYVAKYLKAAIAKYDLQTSLTSEQIVSFLNGLLLGYFIIEATCEGYDDYELWDDEDAFFEGLATLFLQGTMFSEGAENKVKEVKTQTNFVEDLPASLVRSLILRAKKLGKQEYALVYVLFAGGLTVEEILNLKRSHSLIEPQQHLLQIESEKARLVPLNQWILGYKYGSATNNPLTQWLKSRKDEQQAIFINEEEKPISEAELRTLWQKITQDLSTPQGIPPILEQGRSTWCVEMLAKGMDLENLSILSGLSLKQLQPFVAKAKNKAAIEAAASLDSKS